MKYFNYFSQKHEKYFPAMKLQGMNMKENEWIRCPVCGNKTCDRIKEDTVLKNCIFPYSIAGFVAAYWVQYPF